jgi:hypothetical protein
MSPPVLVMPDLQKGIDIYCDACGQGLGCVLMQEGHVIAYASRQLRKQDMKYGGIISWETSAKCTRIIRV